MRLQMSNILIVAAHPDDEVLGCAGVIQYHKSIGDKVIVLIMTYADNGRYPNDNGKLLKDIDAAKSILGWDRTELMHYKDQGLDLIRLTELAQVVEKVIEKDQINIVYTHHYGDINKDHRMCYEATITACRPTPFCGVEKLFSYWIPSSSEWMSYDDNNEFKANFLIDLSVDDRLKKKIQAMKAYQSEVRKYPHPRSEKGLQVNAEFFGLKFGCKQVEPFQMLYDRSLV